MVKVRLSQKQVNTIKEVAHNIFGDDCKVYIFGSRADLTRKGGDIDILIITKDLKDKFRKKLKFIANLYKLLGEQKIDVIVTDYPKTEIEKQALKEGVEI